MTTETKTCRQCKNPFQITEQDLSFYEKISPVFNGKKYLIPPPTFCPDCRMQRRLAFRNERKLYHRKCDLTGKEIISMYSPDKKIKVYDREAWWSDKWNPLDYGRDFDFNRPFFEQFAELLNAVPRMTLNNKDPENSEYCNFVVQNKNCYLLFTSAYNENTYYTNRAFNLKDCADCSSVVESELCYELVDCNKCYNSSWLQNSNNCNDCILGFNLQSCQNCFGCYNLKNAKFCIENKQYSEAEYKHKVAELKTDFDAAKNRFNQLKTKAVRKYINGINLDNCSGDALLNCKNAQICFEGKNLQDCKFLCNTTNEKDCYDAINSDNSELTYEAIGSEENYMHCFNDICWFDSEDYYNNLCFNSKNIFGCVGLKKNSYCILNKQYSKEEYEQLVPKIIEHMQKDWRAHGASAQASELGSRGPQANEAEPYKQEWGEFFPVNISIYGYNETVAQDFFPLSKDQAQKIGTDWKDEDTINRYQGAKTQIPKNIQQVPDTITKQILTCENCSKNYKIIPLELELYRKININVPSICPDCRHQNRLALRNPRKLWDRQCAKCGTKIQTSYSPDRPEIIYCEKCYLEAVY